MQQARPPRGDLFHGKYSQGEFGAPRGTRGSEAVSFSRLYLTICVRLGLQHSAVSYDLSARHPVFHPPSYSFYPAPPRAPHKKVTTAPPPRAPTAPALRVPRAGATPRRTTAPRLAPSSGAPPRTHTHTSRPGRLCAPRLVAPRPGQAGCFSVLFVSPSSSPRPSSPFSLLQPTTCANDTTSFPHYFWQQKHQCAQVHRASAAAATAGRGPTRPPSVPHRAPAPKPGLGRSKREAPRRCAHANRVFRAAARGPNDPARRYLRSRLVQLDGWQRPPPHSAGRRMLRRGHGHEHVHVRQGRRDQVLGSHGAAHLREAPGQGDCERKFHGLHHDGPEQEGAVAPDHLPERDGRRVHGPHYRPQRVGALASWRTR